MVAFVTSIIGLLVGVGVVVLVGQRRPPGTPLTWGEALVGATYAFLLMFLAYGVVPHQWLQWAGNELNWRADSFAFGPNGWFGELEFFGRGRVLVTKQAVKDIIAAGIYIVAIGGHVAMWSWWQKRGRQPAPADLERTSAYGRPLVRSS